MSLHERKVAACRLKGRLVEVGEYNIYRTVAAIASLMSYIVAALAVPRLHPLSHDVFDPGFGAVAPARE